MIASEGRRRGVGDNGGPPLKELSDVLTDKQLEARAKLFGPARHVMLYGGSRSGKTFVACYALIKRALSAPGSRHSIFRHRFNHLKRSIVMDTFPKVMKICFPLVSVKIDKTDWVAKFPNGSEIWFGGLDDKERTEKILGMEFATIYLNECSQIGHHGVRMVRTRLAQRVELGDHLKAKRSGHLPLRMFYDCNPPTTSHWSYKEFVQGIDAVEGQPLPAGQFDALLMNPRDNLRNLPPEYIEVLEALPLRDRLRFLEGIFQSDDALCLWKYESIKRAAETGDLQEVVVAVDPSGSEKGDAVGIVGSGRLDQHYYVIADRSLKATPEKWAKEAIRLYDELLADRIVCERNFGGDMVSNTVRMVAREMHRKGERDTDHVAVEDVVASRGKVLRAEPVSALYERGVVFHLGVHKDLEDELTTFTTDWDRKRDGSPNRLDAAVFALTHLMKRAPSKRSMVFGSVRRTS